MDYFGTKYSRYTRETTVTNQPVDSSACSVQYRILQLIRDVFVEVWYMHVNACKF